MPLDLETMVIAALPSRDGGIDPPQIPAPPGITYQWTNTTIMGEPDLKRLSQLADTGWTFVPPSAHPTVPAMILGAAIATRAFCLVAKPTALIEDQRAKERAPHMDLDIRVLSILERYTGGAPRVSVGGVNLSVSITHRLKDGRTAAPIETLDEIRFELAKRGFPEADIRLFMQRHFGA